MTDTHVSGPPPLRIVAALTFLIACTAFAVDISLPALPDLAKASGSTMAGVQRTVGVFILGFAAGQLPMGMLADRFGRRPVLLIGMSAFVGIGLLTASTDSIAALLVLRCLQGFAAATGAVLSRAVARDITSGQDTVRLMAFLASAMGIAMVVAPALGTLFLWLFGWRGPFMASAFWGGIGLVLTFLYVPETHAAGGQTTILSTLRRGVAAFLRTRAALYGAVMAGLSFCGVMTLVTLSPAVLMGEQGLSPFGFAICFTCVSFGYVTGALITRRFADRLTQDQLAARMGIGFLLTAGLLLLVMMVGTLPAILPAIAIVMGLFGANLGLSSAIALAPLGHVAGVAAGCLGTIQLLTGAAFSFGSTFAGIDRISELLWLLAGLACASSCVMFLYLRKL